MKKKTFQPSFEHYHTPPFKDWETEVVITEAMGSMSSEEAIKMKVDAMLKEGYDKGYESGLSQSLDEATQLKTKLNNVITQLLKPTDGLTEQVMMEIAETMISLTKHCIQLTLNQQPSELLPIFEHIKEEMQQVEKDGVLYMNASNIAFLRDMLPEEPLLSQCHIDDTLQTGDFFIDSPFGSVDGRMSTRIKNIIERHLPLRDERLVIEESEQTSNPSDIIQDDNREGNHE
jgi:flagellar biosynthesis/type III secretory pathway protein FliH